MTSIMIFSPHPDDAELCIGGFILEHSKKYRITIVNLTDGDYSHNGDDRRRESLKIQKQYMNIKYCFLGIKDFSINHLDENQLKKVILLIRKLKPSIIISPSEYDIHPDHKETSKLIKRGVYAAGTNIYRGNDDKHHCKYHFQYSQELFPKNEKIVYFDTTEVHSKKMDLLNNYKSQFCEGERTYLNSYLLNKIDTKDQLCGALVSTEFAEQLILIEGELIFDNIFKAFN